MRRSTVVFVAFLRAVGRFGGAALQGVVPYPHALHTFA
jgi:hypothetical protein